MDGYECVLLIVCFACAYKTMRPLVTGVGYMHVCVYGGGCLFVSMSQIELYVSICTPMCMCFCKYIVSCFCFCVLPTILGIC